MFQPKHFAILAVFALTGCGTINLSGGDFPYGTITVSPQVTSLAAGSSTVFTATNDSNTPFWQLGGYVLAGATNEGTLNGQATGTTVTASSVTYVAPSSPPIYSSGLPSQQGTITLQATEVTGFLQGVVSTQVIAITAPSVTAGLSPATASVALGATQTFTGYAVGNVNNGVTFQVNGITGGSSTVGTISTTGLYTAPSTMPMSGSTVTITLISLADPTKTATATVTLH